MPGATETDPNSAENDASLESLDERLPAKANTQNSYEYREAGKMEAETG